MSGSTETLTTFTPGDLVISISGDGNDSGTYGDNQASPITLKELTTSGTIVGQLVLPQTTSIVNGVTQYAISGEYGSSSEGSLELAANGQSLVMMGYGVNANTFNEGGAAVYGNAALAQSTSVPGGQYTAVPRVIADISYNTTVDTSTALYNVFNTNNPRSVATVNGTTFYISGQGVKGDTTQGVFLAHDGASSATPIDTSTDTRTVEIVNGELYVSRDSTQDGGKTNIAVYGTTLPTSTTAAEPLPGFTGSVTLTAAMENGVNDSDLGQTVNLSPENYFFASPTVLYVADGGDPKEGGLGDGGLQKWVLSNGTWTLEYTLSAGLNLIANTDTAAANVANGPATTGLIGLTGTVVGGNVYLYATNETLGDLNQTYVYAIEDSLAATAPAENEEFVAIATAAADSNIRGISFAPSAPASTTPTVTTVSSGVTSSFVTVSSGSSLDVLNGGTAAAATILSGGTAVVSAGGLDIGSDIANGGSETVIGSASGDFVDGVQLVSGSSAVVTDEAVLNGGSVELFLAGGVANALTIEAGGVLNISAHAVASNTVIDGGLIELSSSKSVLSGAVTFSGAGTIAFASLISAGYGDLAVISGFGGGDVIDDRDIGAGATLSTSYNGTDTTAIAVSGGVSQTLTFAGNLLSNLTLTSDGGSGSEITFSAPPPTSTVIANGTTSSGIVVTSGSDLVVQSGGTAVATAVQSGGTMSVASGGVDSAAVISSGGFETVSGAAAGDAVYGTQLVSASAAIVSDETIYSGGSVELFLKGAVANSLTVQTGGELAISGNATANATVLSGGLIDLESPKAVLGGTVTFAGSGGKIEFTDTSSAGYGDLAVISNFGSGDAVDWTVIGSGASLGTTLSGGNTVATVTSNGVSQSAIFAGNVGSSLELTGDGNGGEEIVFGSRSLTSSGSSGNSVGSGVTESGLVVSGGTTLDVLSGGTIISATILAGGSVSIATGGIDSSTTISAGGNEGVAGSATGDQVHGSQSVGGSAGGETVLAGGLETVQAGGIDSGTTIAASGSQTVFGSATQDLVYGTQLVSAATAVVSDETVFNGGAVELFIAGAVGSGVTVEAGGTLAINGRGTAAATVLSGGTLILESPKATLSGTLTFAGAGTLEETATVSAMSAGILFGDQAVISGFGAGDVIDLTSATAAGAAGSLATMSMTTSGGNTYETITGGGSSETFIFAGTSIGADLTLQSDGAGGEEIVYTPPAGVWAYDEAGDFDTAANWTGNAVPGGLTNAVIDFADDPQVTHDTGNDAVNSLTNEAGDFVMTGGTLTTPFLTNDALMSWTGGSLVLNSGSAATAALTNAAGAHLTIAANGQTLVAIGSGAASVTNQGTILVTGGSGTATIDVPLINTGEIVVTQGTLALEDGGSSNGAGLSGGAGGTLLFNGGRFAVTGGEYQVLNTDITGGTVDLSAASSIFFVNSLFLGGAGTLSLGAKNATAQDGFVLDAPAVSLPTSTTSGVTTINAGATVSPVLSNSGVISGSSTGMLSGSGTLTVFGGANLIGGVETGTGLTRLVGASQIGSGTQVDGGRTIENDGLLNWSSGNIVLGAGDASAATQAGTLTNIANATFYVTADADIANQGAGTSVFNNAGLMVVYAGSGVTDIDAALIDTGVLQLQSGTLSVNGGGSINGGNIFANSSATLQFGTHASGGGGTFTITGAYTVPNTVVNGSTLDLSGASTIVFPDLLDVVSGGLALGAQSATVQDQLLQSGGTIAGTGTLTVFGAATLTGGVETGGGVTHLLGVSMLGGVIEVDGGHTIEDASWLNWSSGTITLGSGDPSAAIQAGTLGVDATGVLYVTADGRIATGAGTGVVNNAGIMAVYAGAGETNIDAVLSNTGVIQVNSGTLSVNGGGGSNGNDIFVASNAVLVFGTTALGTGGTSTIAGGNYGVASTVVNGSTLNVSAANAVGFGTALTIDSGMVQLGAVNASSGVLTLEGGTLAGSGFFFVGGAAQLGAGLETGDGVTVLTTASDISSGAQLDGGRTLANFATLTWTGGTITLGGGDPNAGTHSATLNNEAGAVLSIEGGGTISSAGSGLVVNSGTVLASGMESTTIAVAMENVGTVDVPSGQMTFGQAVSGAGTFLLGGGAALDFADAVGAGSMLQFLQPGGTLESQVLGSFGATILSFAAGDTIDAAGVGFFAGTVTVGFNAGTLTVANATQSAAFSLTGSFSPSGFQIASDGHGGTAVTYS